MAAARAKLNITSDSDRGFEHLAVDPAPYLLISTSRMTVISAGGRLLCFGRTVAKMVCSSACRAFASSYPRLRDALSIGRSALSFLSVGDKSTSQNGLKKSVYT